MRILHHPGFATASLIMKAAILFFCIASCAAQNETAASESYSHFWCEQTSDGLCNTTSEDVFSREFMQEFVNNVSARSRVASTITVDSSTIKNKVFAGYQGWVDTSRWKHWFDDDKPDAPHNHFEMVPSMDEYPANSKRATHVKYTNGKTLSLYENTASGVVDLHFKWMQDYGLDGILLQRFSSNGHANKVLAQVDAAAEKHGRIYAVEWDIGQRADTSWDQKIQDDYDKTVKSFSHNSRYIKEKGKPVVAIFGIGLEKHEFATPSSAQALIKWLQGKGLYVIGSGPFDWRTKHPTFEAVFSQFDAIMPWSVGRYKGAPGFEHQKSRLAADASLTSSRGQDYATVASPGSSRGSWDKTLFNSFPRNGGTFFQSQIDYHLQLKGATFFFIAMFDEVQEGTAIYKFAADKSESCQGAQWLTADIDGVKVPGDHYLTMAGHFASDAKKRR